MDVWYKMGWSFMEASVGSTLEDGKHMSKVKRTVLVQDYPETGHRCLDVETFTRAFPLRTPGSAAHRAEAPGYQGHGPLLGWANLWPPPHGATHFHVVL